MEQGCAGIAQMETAGGSGVARALPTWAQLEAATFMWSWRWTTVRSAPFFWCVLLLELTGGAAVRSQTHTLGF